MRHGDYFSHLPLLLGLPGFYIYYIKLPASLSISTLAMNAMRLSCLLFLHVLPLATTEMLFVETHNDTMLQAVPPKTNPKETDQRSVGSSKEVGQDGQDDSSRGGDEWLNPALMEASEDSWALGHAPARGGGGPSSDHQVGGGSLSNFKDTKDQMTGRPPPLTSWMVEEKKISEERDDEYVEESEEERKKEGKEEERGKLLLIPSQAPRTSRRASVDRGSIGIRSRQGRRHPVHPKMVRRGADNEQRGSRKGSVDRARGRRRKCKCGKRWRNNAICR